VGAREEGGCEEQEKSGAIKGRWPLSLGRRTVEDYKRRRFSQNQEKNLFQYKGLLALCPVGVFGNSALLTTGGRRDCLTFSMNHSSLRFNDQTTVSQRD
jgi:hypothetical protein